MGCALELDQFCVHEIHEQHRLFPDGFDPLDPPPCSCFVTEDDCDAARFEYGYECDWATLSDVCIPTACLDTLGCQCFERERDCIDIEEFPEQCVWNQDDDESEPECSDHNRTTTETPKCTSCSCFESEEDCEVEKLDSSLDCIWMDECIPFRSTETPLDTTGCLILDVHCNFEFIFLFFIH